MKPCKKHKFQIVGSGEIFVWFKCEYCKGDKNIPRGVFLKVLTVRPFWDYPLHGWWFDNNVTFWPTGGA